MENKQNKQDEQNNYAFIDSQNLNLAIRKQGWSFDFKKFRIYLRNKYHINKAFLFIGHIPENKDLYTFLKECGYILIFKPTLKRPDGKAKGNVDSELVLHTMIEISNYDKALIITGDGDFYCLVDYLIKHDKLLRLMIPNQHKYSSLLKKFGHHKVFMNNLKIKLEYKKKKKKDVTVKQKPSNGPSS